MLMEGCAMFPAASYDPETLGVLIHVFNEAWIDVKAMLGANPIDPDGMRSAMAKRIMAAAKSGERDPKRLKLIALKAIDA
jgi:hypothetical protein